jgi:2-keto-4-pentenoate hydratase
MIDPTQWDIPLWQRPRSVTMPAMINETLPVSELDRHALALRTARERRVPIAPLTDSEPALSVSDAYAIAQRNVDARTAAGANIVGHKIGLTSPAVQAQLGVDRPDYGTLLDEMRLDDGATVDAERYIAPRVELELAFRLAAPLPGPNVTGEDVRRATAVVMPAIELVDSRIRDWRIRLADTVADAASSAGFVLGAQARPLDELDPSDIAAELWRGSELIERGHSSAVLGDPCVSVAWLANAVLELGERLEPGQVILSGACTRMVPVAAGDRFRGVLAGLGEVTIAFAGAPA